VTQARWAVYMLRCVDDSFYTGITTDPERRVKEHASDDRKGAKYTRSRRPVVLVHLEYVDTRSAALKRERNIKRLSRCEKLALVKDK